MGRFLLAHGARSAAALWLSCLGAVVLLGDSWIAVDQFVGGQSRTLRGSEAAILGMAASLPSVLRPRLLTWERVNPGSGLRALKALLALGAGLSTTLLAGIAHSSIMPTSESRPIAVNAIAVCALAQLGCVLAGPLLVAPGCIALYWAALAAGQHDPGSRRLLSFLAAAPPDTAPLPAALVLLACSSALAATTLGRSRQSAARDRNHR